MNQDADFFSGKLFRLDALAPEMDRLKAEGKRIVFANGIFDILHVDTFGIFGPPRNTVTSWWWG